MFELNTLSIGTLIPTIRATIGEVWCWLASDPCITFAHGANNNSGNNTGNMRQKVERTTVGKVRAPSAIQVEQPFTHQRVVRRILAPFLAVRLIHRRVCEQVLQLGWA